MSGGGLGEAIPPVLADENGQMVAGFFESGYRTFFDLSFFILITIIALNVVFGIIVDTFSEVCHAT